MVLVFLVVIVMVLVLLVVIVMMVMLGLVFNFLFFVRGNQLLHHVVKRGVGVHRLAQLHAAELVPGSRDQGRAIVVLTDQLDRRLELFFLDQLRAAQNDAVCGFNLVVVEFAEILHIELDLGSVCDGNGCAELGLALDGLFHSDHHVAELADAGGLDQNAVGMVLRKNLLQRGAEIADQSAADAAGVHLGDLNAGFLQETAVNADLAEFVLDQHELFSLIAVSDQLFDQGGFAGAEETGKDINFCHGKAPLSVNIFKYYNTGVKSAPMKNRRIA